MCVYMYIHNCLNSYYYQCSMFLHRYKLLSSIIVSLYFSLKDFIQYLASSNKFSKSFFFILKYRYFASVIDIQFVLVQNCQLTLYFFFLLLFCLCRCMGWYKGRFTDLARQLSWLEHCPVRQKVVGLIPSQGVHKRQLIGVSLSHCCSI